MGTDDSLLGQWPPVKLGVNPIKLIGTHQVGVTIAMGDVDRIEVPTPFAVGPLNCYLVEGGGVTLIDPGPATDAAYSTLLSALENRDYEVRDIERLLITHPHMDHFGLADRLVTESGATVFAHEDAIAHLQDPAGYFERERSFLMPYLRSMGVPDEVVETVLELPASYSRFQAPVSVNVELTQGDQLDIGIGVEVVHTPGHSPSAVCYLAAAEGAAFTGDHVLADITPNPLLTITPADDQARTGSLPTYLDSLRKLRSRGIDMGFGGHGPPIQDLTKRINQILAHHRERKDQIADLVGHHQPTTAYRVMDEMFPDTPTADVFPSMSEIIGHLDLLEDERRVKRTKIDGCIHYERR
jgi:glyoxylase-like metal-dependent hydrolase (beta-lactamase superfamily II)